MNLALRGLERVMVYSSRSSSDVPTCSPLIALSLETQAGTLGSVLQVGEAESVSAFSVCPYGRLLMELQTADESDINGSSSEDALDGEVGQVQRADKDIAVG